MIRGEPRTDAERHDRAWEAFAESDECLDAAWQWAMNVQPGTITDSVLDAYLDTPDAAGLFDAWLTNR